MLSVLPKIISYYKLFYTLWTVAYSISLPVFVINAAIGYAKNLEFLKPKQPYIEFEINFIALNNFIYLFA